MCSNDRTECPCGSAIGGCIVENAGAVPRASHSLRVEAHMHGLVLSWDPLVDDHCDQGSALYGQLDEMTSSVQGARTRRVMFSIRVTTRYSGDRSAFGGHKTRSPDEGAVRSRVDPGNASGGCVEGTMSQIAFMAVRCTSARVMVMVIDSSR